jgi:hypothetical protein
MRNLFILCALIFVVVTGAAAGIVAMTLTSPHSLANSGYRVGARESVDAGDLDAGGR